ncbi:MAG: hydroxymethylbilane synthase [Oscillospiraceae bacterium]|jgi:hydroxymethylbilane synthase|nr:hydroxymethylbilane synthase [Oscillospiraceae bacterium]
MKPIRILTRSSELAVKQAEMVIEAIRRYDAGLTFELILINTAGDTIQNRPLDEIGGKGVFVRELEAALLAGKGDIGVHSCKDMPGEDDPKLPIAAFSLRGDPRDVLVLPQCVSRQDLSKPVGCSSNRRAVQYARICPEARIAPIRGNVPTRLRKLDDGEYSGIILAAAGLARLGLTDRISRVFEISEMIPAACQGIIAVQSRAGTDTGYLEPFRNENAAKCAATERAFIRKLGADCFAPAGVYAELKNGSVNITAMYSGKCGSAIAAEQDAESEAVKLAGRLAECLETEK